MERSVTRMNCHPAVFALIFAVIVLLVISRYRAAVVQTAEITAAVVLSVAVLAAIGTTVFVLRRTRGARPVAAPVVTAPASPAPVPESAEQAGMTAEADQLARSELQLAMSPDGNITTIKAHTG
jgi:hypothetical protein